MLSTLTARSRYRCSRSGFTLVELLTVVALILIFAAMVLASNQNVASQAYNVTFLQQEKELQNAVDLYYDTRTSASAAATEFDSEGVSTVLANAQGMMNYNSRDNYNIENGVIVTDASKRQGYGWSITWAGTGAARFAQGPVVQEVAVTGS